MNIEGSVVAATVGVVIHIFLALLFLFSTVANILVLIIFYRRPALRTISNRFVMSLLVFNLMATGLLLPLVLMDSLIDVSVYAHSSLEHGLCLASQSLTTLVTSGSISAALVIAVDQYCAVMAPLHYHRRITKLRAWLLLAGQWLFASAMAGLSFTDSAGKHFWKGCNLLPPASVTDDVDSLDIGNSSSTVAPSAANQTALLSVAVQDAPVDVWSVLFVSLSCCATWCR